MKSFCLILAAVAAVASPQSTVAEPVTTGDAAATAQSTRQREARNWDVLHSMYPKRALANHEEGLVGFTVKIDAAGSPTECKITHTSGHTLLDQETCQLIMIHATFKRPEGISLSQQRLYEGVVNWKLPATALAAVPAVPAPIQAAAAPEPIICKRTPKIGTLAAFERTCMTKRQWDKAIGETQDHWNEIRKKGYTCSQNDDVCPPEQ